MAGARGPFTSKPLAELRVAPTHPGEVFRYEFLEALDVPVSQAETARQLGWSSNRMNEFILGKRSLTVENAIALAELTGASAEFWMNLQVRNDLWHAIKATKGKSRSRARTPGPGSRVHET